MDCITGKNEYYSESEVQEALIRSHIRFEHAAKNYYQCDDCGEYHLTSQGDFHPILSEPEIKSRIKSEQREQEWTGRGRTGSRRR